MVLQGTCIGNLGGFGHSLFQYAYLKHRALLLGSTCRVETPADWIGRKIWVEAGRDDIVSNKLYSRPAFDSVVLHGQHNLDLCGFYQRSCHTREYTTEWLRELLVLQDEWKALSKEIVGSTDYVACHVRRGDMEKYLSYDYLIIDEESYLSKIDELGLSGCEIRWVCEPGTKLTSNRERWVSDKEDPDDPILSWLPDFLCLIGSRVLLRANSAFSFWAGVLHTGECVFSPRVGNLAGKGKVFFDECNKNRLMSRWDEFNWA